MGRFRQLIEAWEGGFGGGTRYRYAALGNGGFLTFTT